MAEEKKQSEIAELGFEDAIKKLTEIVGKIEQSEIKLADSIEQYEKGMALIKHCRAILQEAEKKIETIGKEE